MCQALSQISIKRLSGPCATDLPSLTLSCDCIIISPIPLTQQEAVWWPDLEAVRCKAIREPIATWTDPMKS